MVGAEIAHSISAMTSVAHLLAHGTIWLWKSSASYTLLVIQLEKSKAFQVLNTLIFHSCLPKQKGHKNNTFSTPNNYSHTSH